MADTATRTIEVNVGPEKFYEVITDYESYPIFLAGLGLVATEIELDDGNQKVVSTKVKKLGKTVSYTLRYLEEPPNKLSWTFVRGQMMSENRGSWLLEKVGDNKTRATYSVEVKFGLLVPKSLVRIMVSKELPAMLDAFKNKAEAG